MKDRLGFSVTFLFLLFFLDMGGPDARTGWQRKLVWRVIPSFSPKIAISCTLALGPKLSH